MTKEEEEHELYNARVECLRTLGMIDGEAACEAVDTIRREAISHRDAMLVFQKNCGISGDREGARFFKTEAAAALSLYRSACLVLAWILANPPGDCVVVSPMQWPKELLPKLRYVMGVANCA